MPLKLSLPPPKGSAKALQISKAKPGKDSMPSSVPSSAGSSAQSTPSGTPSGTPTNSRPGTPEGEASSSVMIVSAQAAYKAMSTPAEHSEAAANTLRTLCSTKSAGERKASACELAGLVAALGLKGLKATGAMAALDKALAAKKPPEAQIGAIAAVEAMSSNLGPLFEPAAAHFLELVLAAVDGKYSKDADACAVAIVKNVTPQACRIVLEPIVASMSSSRWKVKKSAAESCSRGHFASRTRTCTISSRRPAGALPIACAKSTSCQTWST